MHNQALGGDLEFPDDDESFSKSPLLSKMTDFRRHSVPDPRNAPGMSTVLEAARLVVRETGDQYYVQAMMTTGVHAIQMGDATARLLSDGLFAEFVRPYIEEVLRRLAGHGCDLWVHICGNTQHLLPRLRNLPMDGFEVDSQIDLRAARGALGDRVALKGNLDTSFLLQATAKEVYDTSRALLSSGPFETGLVLSPGCAVPKMTPEENISAMVQAAQDSTAMGRYTAP